MFSKFLKMQQDELDNLGLSKQKQARKLEQEQERYESLRHFHDAMGQHQGTTALCFQNQTAMRRQLGNLMDSQEQEMTLAELELQACQKQLLDQFGKVKGLAQLQRKRDILAQRRQKKMEQNQLDDWLNGNRRTG